MVPTAGTLAMLATAVSTAQQFVDVFLYVYLALLFLYVLLTWFRLPYSVWLSRVQGFLYDVCDPYLRLFRRVVPPLGPVDLSPTIAIIVLLVIQRGLHILIGKL